MFVVILKDEGTQNLHDHVCLWFKPRFLGFVFKTALCFCPWMCSLFIMQLSSLLHLWNAKQKNRSETRLVSVKTLNKRVYLILSNTPLLHLTTTSELLVEDTPHPTFIGHHKQVTTFLTSLTQDYLTICNGARSGKFFVVPKQHKVN